MMTGFGGAADPRSAQVVRSAAGLLAEFNRAGVLAAADVHVARRLGALGGEDDDAVLLAAALAVRAVRHGSVCLALGGARAAVAVEGVAPDAVAALPWPEPEGWAAAVAASPLVAVGPAAGADRPLRLEGGLLYLDRYWHQQQTVARWVDAALAEAPGVADSGAARTALDRLFPGSGPDLQRMAASVAASRRFAILAGGPGTGKTWTVARILALLQAGTGGGLRIALAAPTGKAAARLQEAIATASREQAFPAEYRPGVEGLAAVTLHRLLGALPGTGRFRHDRGNHLPHDLVVVDEASMVSLTMMSRLVEALRPECRLLLVGDPDQLTSIDVGAVLGDLAERAAGAGVVRLQVVHRFSPKIQRVAEAIRSGDPVRLRAALDRAGTAVEFVDADAAAAGRRLTGLRDDVVATGRALLEAARAGRAEEALAALSTHQLLCAHREGPHGVSHWGGQVEAWRAEALPGYGSGRPWYPGLPLLVTENDHHLRLYNGDTGVVVATAAGERRAAFAVDGAVTLVPTNRLAAVAPVHALSIHRSQGSQYSRVTVVLPPAQSPLLTRELLYTAVTRAREHVRIIGTWDSLAAAVRRPVVRASGLRRA